MSRRISLCSFCRFKKPGKVMTCDAYPSGVPDRFAFGQEMHISPAEGDHGIRFEMKEGLPEESRRVALQLVETATAKQEKSAKAV